MTFWKKLLSHTSACLLSTLGKAIATLSLRTCRWKIEGLENFQAIARENKCILTLWHNRLALAPFLLTRFAPEFLYAAFVSNSRDGLLISKLVESYKIGRTIRVPHHARHEALRQLIKTINEKNKISIVTPDGPRGPIYQVKPGLAKAAIATEAFVVPLNWEASRYWQLKTWDGLRFPKPFSQIHVTFGTPIQFLKSLQISEQNAQQLLETSLLT